MVEAAEAAVETPAEISVVEAVEITVAEMITAASFFSFFCSVAEWEITAADQKRVVQKWVHPIRKFFERYGIVPFWGYTVSSFYAMKRQSWGFSRISFIID